MSQLAFDWTGHGSYDPDKHQQLMEYKPVNHRNEIYDYLIQQGARPSWAERAINYIGGAMNGNRHFTTDIVRMDCKIEDEQVRTCKVVVKFEMPDSGKSGRAAINYRFHPDKHVAHRCTFTTF